MNKTWNTYVIGVLASDESVQHALGKKAIFKNTQNVMQFYVRIISKVPDSFPHIRLVTFFGTDLEKWGFEEGYLEEAEGRRALQHFLAENLLAFKPQRKMRQDGTDGYDGKDIILIPKSEMYHEGVHLTPLPIFSEEEQGISQKEFERRLQSQHFVGKIDHISSEKNDTPRYVLWKNSDFDFVVYGEFFDHNYGDDGFSFKVNQQLKSATFNEEWLDDCYEHENTLFVPYEICSYIDETIRAREPFDTSISTADNKNDREFTQTEMIEEDLIEQFIATTKAEGLLYDKRDLYNFHTAMKSSNFVILAGMSGTGKSKLVKAYTKALGLDETCQLTFIPVRPAWTDDADVIGYADTLNHVYRPGDSGVINALLSAKEKTNVLHIICFDEMNLARVEHYFSQFLSVLEMETGPSRVLRLYNDNLEDKLTNSNVYPPVIPIGDNVIFVGTVNLDESTYHFSDKVLDRANVISLNVLPFSYLKKVTEETEYTGNKAVKISFDQFNSFQNKNQEIQMNEKELEFLWELHTQLQKVNNNLGAGPRIVRQIDMYLKNLPKSSTYSREEAFDKQVVQRILTKVRGPEVKLKRFIGSFDVQTETIEESIVVEILDRYHDISKFSETRNVLIHKAKELKVNGYTL